MVTLNSKNIILICVILIFTFCRVSLSAQNPYAIQDYQDSIKTNRVDSLFAALQDSATWEQEQEFIQSLNFTLPNDSLSLLGSDVKSTPEVASALGKKKLSWRQKDSLMVTSLNFNNSVWEPNPKKATWIALLLPGGGQIYNKKYWKLPIVYGGFVGCLYALTWNNQMYRDYSKAYVDITDNDPNTNSYEDFVPSTYDIESNYDWLTTVMKNRKDKYRRYRDMSIFVFAGVYIVSVIDAYVDAELSHFDVSSDLSMRITPDIINTGMGNNVGFQLAFTF